MWKWGPAVVGAGKRVACRRAFHPSVRFAPSVSRRMLLTSPLVGPRECVRFWKCRCWGVPDMKVWVGLGCVGLAWDAGAV